jgi:dimethylglycine dehydrogenase
MRWFHRYLPAKGVTVSNVTNEWMGLGLAGPKSRDVLQQLTRTDLSNDLFPFMSVAEISIGIAPCRVDRVSLTGELGYEIWMPTTYMRHVYTQLHEAGADIGIRNVGVVGLLSMRLEKIFGIWGREFSPDYRPSQNEMSRFVQYDKPDFVGRDAALADRDAGPASQLSLLSLDTESCDATGFEPVYREGRKVGFVTSGGYGHRTNQSLALAYIDTPDRSSDVEYEVPIVGQRYAARLLGEAPFDPTGTAMRS